MFAFHVWPTVCANIHCSRQIRPPIYSLKQNKLRKRRVVRFAMLYFFLLVVFLALIIGPTVAGKFAQSAIAGFLPQGGILAGLGQPVGLNNTYAVYVHESYTGAWPGGQQTAGASMGGSGGGGGGGGAAITGTLGSGSGNGGGGDAGFTSAFGRF